LSDIEYRTLLLNTRNKFVDPDMYTNTTHENIRRTSRINMVFDIRHFSRRITTVNCSDSPGQQKAERPLFGIVKISGSLFCCVAKPWIATPSTTFYVQARKKWCWVRNDGQGKSPFYTSPLPHCSSLHPRSNLGEVGWW